jgi:hypothetical protein
MVLWDSGDRSGARQLLIHVGGFNLSLVLRLVIGKGTPRGLQDLALAYFVTLLLVIECTLHVHDASFDHRDSCPAQVSGFFFGETVFEIKTSATGC